jgi:hypothetical protein
MIQPRRELIPANKPEALTPTLESISMIDAVRQYSREAEEAYALLPVHRQNRQFIIAMLREAVEAGRNPGLLELYYQHLTDLEARATLATRTVSVSDACGS